ncbi:MAG: preprotein translocase, YajC subunit [Verrucomicrobia bacterium]|nr:preprotein translocase, YajC subunit [Verrucomicrobiota bacterium]
MPKMSLMTDSVSLLAQAAPSGPGGMDGKVMLIFYGLLFAAMYFLMIAPQRKKQKELEKTIASLSTGDEIVTTGGIYGTITNVKDDRFVVRIADNTKIEIAKAFIGTVVKKTDAEKK